MMNVSEWGLQKTNVWNHLKFFLVKKKKEEDEKKSGGFSGVLLKRSVEAGLWHAAVLRI